MKNVIEGYGDQYLKPTYSLLDDLAADLAMQKPANSSKLPVKIRNG